MDTLPADILGVIAGFTIHNGAYATFAIVSTEFNKYVRRAISNIPITLEESNIKFVVAGMDVNMSTIHRCGAYDILINTPDFVIRFDYNNCTKISCNEVLAIKTFANFSACECKSPITKMVLDVIMQEYIQARSNTITLPSAPLSPSPGNNQ